MNLNAWFSVHARRPLIVVAILVSALWAAFMYWSVQATRSQQLLSVEQLKDLTSVALSQKNRVLVESILQSALSQLGARAAAICSHNRPIVSSNYSPVICEDSQSYFVRSLGGPIPGSADLRLVVHLPVFQNVISPIVFLITVVSLLAFVIGLVWRVKLKLDRDIFMPMTTGLLGEERLSIEELEKARVTLRSAQRAETDLAVANAIVERNRQIAHDIRSPLSALNILSSVIDGASETHLSVLRAAVGRIRDIADGLLSLKNDQVSVIQKQVNVSELLMKILIEKRMEYSTIPNLKIENEIAENLFAIVNTIEFSRVISNLINNSVNALIGKNGAIRVSAYIQKSNLVVSVLDNGSGIPESVLGKLGTRGLSTSQEGHGLGLYHAHQFAKASSGYIEVKSRLGQGTEVDLRLPIVRENRDQNSLLLT